MSVNVRLARSLIVTAVAAGLVGGPATAHADMQAVGQPLVVRSYYVFSIPSSDLKTAQTTARAILSDAGIKVVWRDCWGINPLATRLCQEVLEPAELVVRIVASRSQSTPNQLGYSLVDVQQRAGSLATIYGDRVRAFATESHVDFGKLLGRSIAHEIGHLLLGTSDHSNRGLMRGSWSTTELNRDRPWEWEVSRTEAAEMRRALATRSRRPNGPGQSSRASNRDVEPDALGPACTECRGTAGTPPGAISSLLEIDQ